MIIAMLFKCGSQQAVLTYSSPEYSGIHYIGKPRPSCRSSSLKSLVLNPYKQRRVGSGESTGDSSKATFVHLCGFDAASGALWKCANRGCEAGSSSMRVAALQPECLQHQNLRGLLCRAYHGPQNAEPAKPKTLAHSLSSRSFTSRGPEQQLKGPTQLQQS